MSNASKQMIIGSMAVAGLVALASIVDIITAIPFAGQIVMDIMFLLAAGLVIFMGYDSYKDLT